MKGYTLSISCYFAVLLYEKGSKYGGAEQKSFPPLSRICICTGIHSAMASHRANHQIIRCLIFPAPTFNILDIMDISIGQISILLHMAPSGYQPFPLLTTLPPTRNPSPYSQPFPLLTTLPPTHSPSPYSQPFPLLTTLPPTHNPSSYSQPFPLLTDGRDIPSSPMTSKGSAIFGRLKPLQRRELPFRISNV